MVVKISDDLMSATRYGMMMRRFAKTQEEAETRLRPGRMAPVLPFTVFDETTGY
jgi:hypothetical protein